MIESKIEIRLTPKCVQLYLNGELLNRVQSIDGIKKSEETGLVEVTLTLQTTDLKIRDLDGRLLTIPDCSEVQDV